MLQLESLLSPQLPLLDLLLVSPQRKQARPRPTPCVAGGSSAATKACRKATGLRDRGPGQGGGKAQVNTAVLWPMWAGGGGRQRVGWRAPRGLRDRKGSVRHIQTCSRHRWEGWTRQKASSSSCQAGRWQESSLSFQQGGPACPQRSTDPQVAAQIAGHREREEGQRGPLQRREAGGKPHASFNSGMSTGREGRKAQWLPHVGLCSTPDPTVGALNLKK